MAFTIQAVSGVERNERRGLVWLAPDVSDRLINAAQAFDALKQKDQDLLRRIMEHWRDGGTNKQWHHGWKKDDVGALMAQCYVFKKPDSHRFYGFLCQPLPDDTRFVLCVLVHSAQKHTYETDKTMLGRVAALAGQDDVRTAIRAFVNTSERTRRR